MTAFIGNTNLLELTDLKSEVDGAFINDALVQATVVDKDGNEVTGGPSWPATMAYVASSNGNYRLALSDGLSLVEDRLYKAIVTADGGTDRKGRWEFRFRPKTRDDI